MLVQWLNTRSCHSYKTRGWRTSSYLNQRRSLLFNSCRSLFVLKNWENDFKKQTFCFNKEIIVFTPEKTCVTIVLGNSKSIPTWCVVLYDGCSDAFEFAVPFVKFVDVMNLFLIIYIISTIVFNFLNSTVFILPKVQQKMNKKVFINLSLIFVCVLVTFFYKSLFIFINPVLHMPFRCNDFFNSWFWIVDQLWFQVHPKLIKHIQHNSLKI